MFNSVVVFARFLGEWNAVEEHLRCAGGRGEVVRALRAARGDVPRARHLPLHLRAGRRGQRHPRVRLHPTPRHPHRAQHLHIQPGAGRHARDPDERALHVDAVHGGLVAVRHGRVQGVRGGQGRVHRRVRVHADGAERRPLRGHRQPAAATQLVASAPTHVRRGLRHLDRGHRLRRPGRHHRRGAGPGARQEPLHQGVHVLPHRHGPDLPQGHGAGALPRAVPAAAARHLGLLRLHRLPPLPQRQQPQRHGHGRPEHGHADQGSQEGGQDRAVVRGHLRHLLRAVPHCHALVLPQPQRDRRVQRLVARAAHQWLHPVLPQLVRQPRGAVPRVGPVPQVLQPLPLQRAHGAARQHPHPRPLPLGQHAHAAGGLGARRQRRARQGGRQRGREGRPPPQPPPPPPQQPPAPPPRQGGERGPRPPGHAHRHHGHLEGEAGPSGAGQAGAATVGARAPERLPTSRAAGTRSLLRPSGVSERDKKTHACRARSNVYYV